MGARHPSTRNGRGEGASASRRWKDCALGQELFTLHNLMMRIGDRLVSDIGLTGSRWLLLSALDHYREPPTLSQLSTNGLLSVQNVSRMVEAMERDGLLERYTRPGRGRAVHVRLTPRGRRVRDQTVPRGEQFAAAFLRGFSSGQIGRLQDDLDALLANLDAFEHSLDGDEPADEARVNGSARRRRAGTRRPVK